MVKIFTVWFRIIFRVSNNLIVYSNEFLIYFGDLKIVAVDVYLSRLKINFFVYWPPRLFTWNVYSVSFYSTARQGTRKIQRFFSYPKIRYKLYLLFVVSGYELALFSSFKMFDPSIELCGYLFNYSQCPWRKIQQLALETVYKTAPSAKRIVKRFLYLPLL